MFKEREKRAIRRKNDIKKAIRKKHIAENIYGFEYYDNLHQYSKNKIHCSCSMCKEKSNSKSSKGNGHGFRGDKAHDMWRVEPYNVTIDGQVHCILPGVPNNPFVSRSGKTDHRRGKNWNVSDTKKHEKMAFDEREYFAL